MLRNNCQFNIKSPNEYFSSPNGARVSGVVEETPGRLEYEVALYKEAPPARLGNNSNELPVDQAVPIGTKLQLRARINPESGIFINKSTKLLIKKILQIWDKKI